MKNLWSFFIVIFALILSLSFLCPDSINASPQIIDNRITDVSTKSFSIICTLSECCRGTLAVFDNSGFPLTESGIIIENESAEQPQNPDSYYTHAEIYGILKVTVKGLKANTNYFYQIIAGDTKLPVGNPINYGDLYKVNTQRLNSHVDSGSSDIVTNDILVLPMYKEDGVSPALGSLILIDILDDESTLNDYPLSAWVGSCSSDKQYACINLNNLYDKDHTPLDLDGGEKVEIIYLSGEQDIFGGKNRVYYTDLPLETKMTTASAENITIPEPRIADFYYYSIDADYDGYGKDGDPDLFLSFSSTPTPPYGYASNTDDCDDTDPAVYPGATEACDDVDNDCDGSIDEENASGCSTYYKDADDDTYGLTFDSKCLCDPNGDYTATQGGDCNDSNSAIHPGATEACDNEDNDCDGSIDEENASGCSTYYKDADDDTYGLTSDSKCLCDPNGDYTATRGGDCNDKDHTVYPDAPGTKKGKDNNCNGKIDKGEKKPPTSSPSWGWQYPQLGMSLYQLPVIPTWTPTWTSLTPSWASLTPSWTPSFSTLYQQPWQIGFQQTSYPQLSVPMISPETQFWTPLSQSSRYQPYQYFNLNFFNSYQPQFFNWP